MRQIQSTNNTIVTKDNFVNFEPECKVRLDIINNGYRGSNITLDKYSNAVYTAILMTNIVFLNRDENIIWDSNRIVFMSLRFCDTKNVEVTYI